MLASLVYRDLGDLIRLIGLLRTRLEAGADTPEVELLARAVTETVRRLAAAVGSEAGAPAGKLAQHLHWLVYYHARGQHEKYQRDMEDIIQRDLPGVINSVVEWEEKLLPDGLSQATSGSWEGRNYVNAVRDAFVLLEEELRRAGGVHPPRGRSAGWLVSHLLSPDSPDRIDLAQAQFAPTTKSEHLGVMYLFKGAFLLFRNPAAHRRIELGPEQADEILRLVGLCLRYLPRSP